MLGAVGRGMRVGWVLMIGISAFASLENQAEKQAEKKQVEEKHAEHQIQAKHQVPAKPAAQGKTNFISLTGDDWTRLGEGHGIVTFKKEIENDPILGLR